MAKLDIKILNSVNGARFGSTSSIVHKALGEGYKKEEPREFTDEDKDFLLTICKNFSEKTAKPLKTELKSWYIYF